MTVQELEDEEERAQGRKRELKEAFSGDDVIRDFLKEKREAVEASKPKDLDLTLPGWGKWGGMGLKPSAKKRCRFLIKAPEGPLRKDKNLPNVIINEKRNTHAAAHQVRDREQFRSLLFHCRALLLGRSVLVLCGQEGCVILTTDQIYSCFHWL